MLWLPAALVQAAPGPLRRCNLVRSRSDGLWRNSKKSRRFRETAGGDSVKVPVIRKGGRAARLNQ